MRKKRDTPPKGETPTTPPDLASGHHPLEEPTTLEESAPVTPSPHLLSPAYQRFCQEYLHDLNGAKAYMRAYPNANYETAKARAWELLQLPTIRNEVQRLLDERATVTGITADRALIRLWETATADARELVEVRVGSCRYCWGLYHQYQYTDSEWEKVLHDHVHAEAARRKAEKGDFQPRECHEKGGTGYTPNRPPNPDCPECHGDGRPRSIIKDLRQASPGALSLYGGVKYDKHGNMQVLVRDQLPALKLVAEHLGLFNGLRPPDASDPLTTLLEEIRGAHGAGSALQIVHEDPERRQVQDVEAKPAKPQVSERTPEPGSGSKPPSKKQWRPMR